MNTRASAISWARIFVFQAEDGIRDLVRSRGLGDVYKRQDLDWKLRIAHRIHDLAVDRYGLEPGDLIFDALTLSLIHI